MQPFREPPTALAVETTFEGPRSLTYYVVAGMMLIVALAAFAGQLGENASWVVGLAFAVLGGLTFLLAVRTRRARVTVSTSGFCITGNKVIDCPFSDVEEVRTVRGAVGYGRTVFVRTIVRRDGQQITLPAWLDADFDAVFDAAFTASRLPVLSDKLGNGQVVKFGSVTVAPDSLRGPENKMTMDQLAFAEIASGDDGPILRIQSVNETWPAIALTDVPNSAVLVALLKTLKPAP